MKICFLAPANNYHTKKWCNWFASQGHEVHVVSFIKDSIDNVTVHYIDTGASSDSSDSKKIKYLLKAGQVKKIVDEICPDIVNVHYATSYGTVAALAGLKSYILSVWGSDVYDFPQKSFLHRWMLEYSLYKAKYIFSTSQAMADETHKYTKKKIEITPFGVNMDLFNPNKRTRSYDLQQDGKFIVGTVKALTPKYGIDYLLRAVSIIKKEHPEIPIYVRIAGKGEKELEYKELAEQLEIADIVTWLGFIPQEEAAREWANMDIAVIPSLQESFGVSAVEAQACQVPVIISDVPGLKEATRPQISSVVLEKIDAREIADDILQLYENEHLRIAYGIAGRKFVDREFEINHCFKKIEKIYEKYNYIEKNIK